MNEQRLSFSCFFSTAWIVPFRPRKSNSKSLNFHSFDLVRRAILSNIKNKSSASWKNQGSKMKTFAVDWIKSLLSSLKAPLRLELNYIFRRQEKKVQGHKKKVNNKIFPSLHSHGSNFLKSVELWWFKRHFPLALANSLNEELLKVTLLSLLKRWMTWHNGI